MKKRFQVTDADREKIRQAVVEAESKTSGEVVPLLAEASGNYSAARFGGATIGWALASLLLWDAHLLSPFPLSLWVVFAAQSVGAVLGFLLGTIPVVARFLLPRSVFAEAVHRQALADFVRLGLHHTREGTGVLIYFSRLERRVEIVADKGIHKKVGEDYWKKAVETLVVGIHKGSPVETLVGVIGEIGKKLATDFPKQADDTNELSDHLRT